MPNMVYNEHRAHQKRKLRNELSRAIAVLLCCAAISKSALISVITIKRRVCDPLRHHSWPKNSVCVFGGRQQT